MKYTLLRSAAVALIFAATAAQAQVAVGHLADYSGPTADVGVPFGQGVADALALINQKGGVNNQKLNVDTVDTMIKNVSTIRSTFGAVQNRLEHRLANLSTYQENLVASESRIRDVDMASEMVNFTKLQILQQAGTSMLAQANQAPQGVLSLLR